MKFTRSKKLLFCNNKGGVGKTLLAFNTAVYFAKQGYKVALIDLDPQCNLSRLCIGENFEEEDLLSDNKKNIYDVIKGVVEGGSDIDSSIKLEKTKYENLFILPGSSDLTYFESILSNAYNLATGGQPLGYFQTSSIDRFLTSKEIDDGFDIFVIDTGPSLGLLNQIIFLGVDYFVVPMMPSVFSLQGIQKISRAFDSWKQNWQLTAVALAKRPSSKIKSKDILSGKSLFIGYVINSYNQYSKKPIQEHKKWIDKIKTDVVEFFAVTHTINGLSKMIKEPLEIIKDYGQLPALCERKGDTIFELDPKEVSKLKCGTIDNLELSKTQFSSLGEKILEILKKY